MSAALNRDPSFDGDTPSYYPIARSYSVAPRFYYVNGIRTDKRTHRFTAEFVANLTRSRVTGVYNATSGTAGDLWQCAGDWVNVVGSQLIEEGFWADRLAQAGINAQSLTALGKYRSILHLLREVVISPKEIQGDLTKDYAVRKSLARNKASQSLYSWLTKYQKQKQIIVAHSQGNLVTSFALWGIQTVYGTAGLKNIYVRSISSPSPTWPRGINNRIKVYGQNDDPVTWFDPKNWLGNKSAGFWDTYFPNNPIGYVKSGGIAAHDVRYNIINTSLARRLRDDAGIAKF